MLSIERGDFEQEEWHEIVTAFDDLSVMQTWEYGEAKHRVEGWRVDRMVFCADSQIVSATQALVKTIPVIGGGLVWINQGPLWRESTGSDTGVPRQALAALREHYVRKEGKFLRVAPTVPEHMAEAVMCGTEGFDIVVRSEGWHSARVDLTRSLEEIRASLARKWRGDLSAAERRGARCQFSQSAEALREFLDHYLSFIERRRLATRLTPRFLETLQELLPSSRKMWIFEGRAEDEYLGGLLMAVYGDTALALAGSNPNERGRELRSGNLVWWSVIREMKAIGLRWLDVGGTSPTTTPKGILHFKAGLNGEPMVLMKECEASNAAITDRIVEWRVRRARGEGV